MSTTYPGINYAGSQPVNIDTTTGIRYSVISQNDVMAEALDDIYSNGRDLGFESFKAEIRQRLDNALSDYLSATAICEAFDAIEDYIGDSYSSNGESGPYYLEQDGYALKTDDSNDLWVLKSPYFTFAQFCSPCAPGACHLGNPLDMSSFGSECQAPENNAYADNRCYCLGHDWFEDGKAPYRLWSVETGNEILPE